MNLSWFFCLYVLCASPGPSLDAEPVTASDVQKGQKGSEEETRLEQRIKKEDGIQGKERAIRGDTGKPPGVQEAVKSDVPLKEAPGEMPQRPKTDEIARAEVIPSLQAPPIIEDMIVSDIPGIRLRQEGRREEPARRTKEEAIDSSKDDKQTLEGKTNPSEDSRASLPSGEAGMTETDDQIHEGETQIEAPALASMDDDPTGSETLEEHVDQIPEDLPMDVADDITVGRIVEKTVPGVADGAGAMAEALPETGDIEVEPGGDKGEDSKGSSEKTNDDGEKLEDGRDGIQKSDEGAKKMEDDGTKLEKGSEKAEDRIQKPEGGVDKPEDGIKVELEDTDEGKPVDDEILLSFHEWKEKEKEKLEKEMEAQEKQYGGQHADIPPPSKQRQFSDQDSKNYASSDCGAKIISANKEAQKANDILNFNRDDYMINPCTANIWFIVELCEPIQIKLLEMANLELFSSVPESFAVYTSDRFPAREWRPLGTRFAKEQRTMQSFQFNEHLFTKFVKIELLTFFGKEHFCPLTVLRIFGTSMEEEIDAEEIGEAVLPPSPTPLAEDKKETKENGILDHAKDAVMSFVKNAAKAFTGEDQGTVECQGDGCPDVAVEGVDPTPATDCGDCELTTSIPDARPIDDFDICVNACGDDIDSDEFKGTCAAALCDQPDYWRIFPNCCLLVLAHTTIHLCCGVSQSLPRDDHTEGDGVVDTPEEVAKVEGDIKPPTLDIIPLETAPPAKGLIVSNLSKDQHPKLSPSPIVPTIVKTAPSVESSQALVSTSPPVQVNGTPAPLDVETLERKDSGEAVQDPAVVKKITPTPSWKEEEDLEIPAKSSPPPMDPKSKTASSGTSSVEVAPTPEPVIIPPVVKTPTDGAAKVQDGQKADSEKVDAKPKTSESATSSPPNEQTIVDPKSEEGIKKDDGVKKVDGVIDSEAASKTGVIPQDNVGKDKGGEGAGTPTPVEEKVDTTGSKTEAEQAREGAAPATQQAEKGAETVPSGGAQATHSNGHMGINYGSQKDSLFMRLNNRIKSLELNLSLSSKYLEELSKSYKKQMEEMHKSFNKTVISLKETVQKSQEKHQSNTEDITRLDGEVQELTSTVSSLSLKTEDILQEVIERHLFLMVCEVLFFCALFMVCIRRERNQLRLARAMYENHLQTPQRRNTLSHSNPSQRTVESLPDRGSLRPSGSLDDLLIIGPTTPLREAIRANTSQQPKAKPKHKTASSGVMTNGSLPDVAGHGPQLPKGPKRKTDYKSFSKPSYSAGDLVNGSLSDVERSKSDTNGYGRHSPESIGATNGSHGSKLKKVFNGSKVKR